MGTFYRPKTHNHTKCTRGLESYCFVRNKVHMTHTAARYTPRLFHLAYLNTIVVNSQSLLQKVHSPYISQFCRQCGLVLLILIPNNFQLLYAYPVADYFFFPDLQFSTIFHSIASFSQDVTNPLSLLCFLYTG